MKLYGFAALTTPSGGDFATLSAIQSVVSPPSGGVGPRHGGGFMTKSQTRSVLNSPPPLPLRRAGPGLIQSGDADARANLVTFVDADEHAGEWFELARQAQPAGDDAAMTGDGFGEIGDDV